MRLADFCALLIAGLLMLLVMTMLGIELLPSGWSMAVPFSFSLA